MTIQRWLLPAGVVMIVALVIIFVFGVDSYWKRYDAAQAAEHFPDIRRQIVERLVKLDTLRNTQFKPEDFINLDKYELQKLERITEWLGNFFTAQDISSDEATPLPGTPWNITRIEKAYFAFSNQVHLESGQGKTVREVRIALPHVWETANTHRYLIFFASRTHISFTCTQETQETEKRSVRAYDLSVSSSLQTMLDDHQAKKFYEWRVNQGASLFDPPCEKPKW